MRHKYNIIFNTIDSKISFALLFGFGFNSEIMQWKQKQWLLITICFVFKTRFYLQIINLLNILLIDIWIQYIWTSIGHRLETTLKTSLPRTGRKWLKTYCPMSSLKDIHLVWNSNQFLIIFWIKIYFVFIFKTHFIRRDEEYVIWGQIGSIFSPIIQLCLHFETQVMHTFPYRSLHLI